MILCEERQVKCCALSLSVKTLWIILVHFNPSILIFPTGFRHLSILESIIYFVS